jgi:hypothetical protein
MLATCPAIRSLLSFNLLAELNDHTNNVGPCYVMPETVRFLYVCVRVLAVDIFLNFIFSNMLNKKNKTSRKKKKKKKWSNSLN